VSSSMSAAALAGSISKAIWAQSARTLLCGIEPALRMSTLRNDVTENRTFPYGTFSIFRAAVQQNRLGTSGLTLFLLKRSNCFERSNHQRSCRFSAESSRRSTTMPCTSSGGRDLGEGRGLALGRIPHLVISQAQKFRPWER
jgi:hypothetical protein